ncbi:MAG: hypothetical protein WB615_12745 [Candidatus Tumulicola sp.]
MDRAANFQVGAGFESLLLAPMLRSLFPAAGVLGGDGLELVAREIAAHDGSGFADVIAAQLEPKQ